MIHDDTLNSEVLPKSLSNVKKARKLFENDANLLSNRIKLLQLEEAKTWKFIKDTQKKKEKIQEYRKVKEAKIRQHEQISEVFERQLEENMQKIKMIKMEIERNKLNSKKVLQSSKKVAYVETKRLKQQISEQRVKFEEDFVNENKKRSTSVRVEHIKQGIRKKQDYELKLNRSKEDYLKRVNKEIEIKEELADKLNQMEVMELELIRRLQNTQNIQQKVLSEFESMKKNRIASSYK